MSGLVGQAKPGLIKTGPFSAEAGFSLEVISAALTVPTRNPSRGHGWNTDQTRIQEKEKWGRRSSSARRDGHKTHE